MHICYSKIYNILQCGPMNLGMSFHNLCFGSAKFLVDRYTKSFIWYSTPGLQHLLE